MTDPITKREAYRATIEDGEDVSLRRQVAAALARQPMTTHELGQHFADRSANAIRPRVNELLRMGCVKREGTRTNPSGHEAYVHHLTEKGQRYLTGEIDPEPGPTESELKTRVVDIAREVTRGNADRDVLELAVWKHDQAKQRADPDWTPPEPQER